MPAPFTNPYQAPDLALTLPHTSFTNPPLRPGGIDTSQVEHSRTQWNTVAQHGTQSHSRVVAHERQGHTAQHVHTVHTVKSGTSRRMTHTGSVMVLVLEKFLTRPACVF